MACALTNGGKPAPDELSRFLLLCAQSGDQFLECGGAGRLADQVSESSLPDVLGDRRVSASGMGNKRRITRPYLFLQLSGGFVTVDSRRHAEVQNDQLGHKRRRNLDRLFAALRQANLTSNI